MPAHRLAIPLAALVALILLDSSARSQEKPNPLLAQIKAGVKDPTKPFTLIVQLQVKEGSEGKFETAFARAIPPTRKEKGCLAYDLNRDARKPTHYLVYERWQNLAALEAHLKSAHITTLLREVGDLLAGPPEGRILLPADHP
jgi:quinol monooxygenase YgiN